MMERLERVRTKDRKEIEKFLLIDDWRERVTGVIVMTASPEDAMEREKGHLPIEETTGSIMNTEVLQRMLDITHDAIENLKRHFRIYPIDTSSGETKNNPRRTSEIVVDIVLSLIEEQLQEDILCLPKSMVASQFNNTKSHQVTEASELVKLFLQSGEFQPREQVEQDDTLVQALPVVVVRNRSGEILRLRRRERSDQKVLHEKIVLWAGGHVRKEDATNGDSLVHCALRELQEELRLSLEAKDLKLVGAVYADIGESTSKHVALVYEWRAETDDVAVALSSAEFFERRGNSLSGKFVDVEDLASDIEAGKISEVWSVEIIRELLAKDSFKFKPRLF
jgi:predicted NUDIX family phosphoesterase